MALEPILFTSNFWQILVVVALDEHVLTKTSLIGMYVTRSTELTLGRFFPTTLRSPATRDFWPLIGRTVFARLAGVCVACTTCGRRRLWLRSFGVIWIRISDPRSVWIMVHQRNRRIHDQSGLTGSFDAP